MIWEPATLARWVSGDWRGPPAGPVAGFAIDTRTLLTGQLFVALRAARDGHDFLSAAAAQGAAGALVARFLPEVDLPQLVVADTLAALQAVAAAHRAAFTGPLVGVTGSCGKTSTKELLAVLLGAEATHRTAGNLNNHLGVPLTLLGLDPARHSRAVVEMGMNAPGEIAPLAALARPSAAAVTMVGPAHLEKLGSLEAIAAEKAALPRAVAAAGAGPVAFPAACLAYQPFRELLATNPILTTPEGADASAAPSFPAWRFATVAGGDVTGLRLVPPAGPALALPLPPGVRSPGLLANTALAAVLALALGESEEALRVRLPRSRPAALRGEVLQDGQRTFFADCYNANPASLADAFEAFASLFPGPEARLYVLGPMGELGPEARAWHRSTAARLALRPQDRAVTVGNQADALAEGLRDAGATRAQVLTAYRAEDARAVVEGFAGRVFLKGSRAAALEVLLPATAPKAH